VKDALTARSVFARLFHRMYAANHYKKGTNYKLKENAEVGRIVKLSVAALMIAGGTGTAFSNWSNYDFYSDPSSGSLSATLTSTDIASANFGFNPMPDGSFGPPTTSFQNSYSHLWAFKPQTVLTFKDRWSFDYWTGGHPHRQQNDASRHHGRSLLALMGL
jgi:hypothetical protein